MKREFPNPFRSCRRRLYLRVVSLQKSGTHHSRRTFTLPKSPSLQLLVQLVGLQLHWTAGVQQNIPLQTGVGTNGGA